MLPTYQNEGLPFCTYGEGSLYFEGGPRTVIKVVFYIAINEASSISTIHPFPCTSLSFSSADAESSGLSELRSQEGDSR
jgi:hypothetical protein